MTAPVTAKWAYSRPSVYLPDSKSLPSLWPPKRNALPEDVHAWHCNVAAVLLQQAETAVGGMLSLSTSFATVQRLRELLYPNLGERLIWQRDGYSANRCAKDFVDLYRAGIKPVWLGTGGAWTGLDLRDLPVPLERAHEDNLLTDLNINRIPFGVNRSLTHQHRKETFGFACEKTEVEFIFRQGMGRLVRSDGVNDRRLVICDARLRLPAYAAVCSGVLLELKRYKQIHALSTLADSYEAKAA